MAHDSDRKTKKKHTKPKGKKPKNGSGAEPNDNGRMSRSEYEAELRLLQGELVRLQRWVRVKKKKVMVVFEGRDAAGKGGVIKAIAARTNPRVVRTVALPAPDDRERTQMYMQRYFAHFPAGGEMVLFDRSWYNRAGVERVMGFCTEDEYRHFLDRTPSVEQAIQEAGIQLIKYWFDINQETQKERFLARLTDPRKTWKLSRMDIESYRRWYQYSIARDAMFDATDTRTSPWHLVRADDKRRGRLNCIAHMLSQIPYTDVPTEPVDLGRRDTTLAYDDSASIAKRRFVPERY